MTLGSIEGWLHSEARGRRDRGTPLHICSGTNGRFCVMPCQVPTDIYFYKVSWLLILELGALLIRQVHLHGESYALLADFLEIGKAPLENLH